ncbi:hypothetical protein ALC62_05952 [Cyphomyrmex costatus]|uniref:Uncharacterized protein n=1 Tax=Cyphomyrmex costatus TaxID=456900 RepID=A0A151IJ98_9HYME|nr:hypothetical protein ALC62_05952 [Cyphomyrmex costatus]
MRFVRQSRTIEVSNLDAKVQTEREMRKHGNMLPSTVRAIVCGPSNCGKTNVLISLLESPNGVRFENVYVYSKSLRCDRTISSDGLGPCQFVEFLGRHVLSPPRTKVRRGIVRCAFNYSLMPTKQLLL